MGKGTRKNSGMGRDDFLLWKAFTHDIEPLEPRDWAAFEDEAEDAPVPRETRTTPERPKENTPVKHHDATSPSMPVQLDARTEARLRRGQMPVEGRLDLHGMTQAVAHERLTRFLVNAHASGKRCVLIITGKGLSRAQHDDREMGVLRQKLPLWLSLAPLSHIVLKHFPAVQRDGGTGAWYIYLKRQRDY